MIHAVIPVKALGAAKSRLSGVLSAAERRQLALIMLGDVLAVVSAAPAVGGVTVVSRDPSALALAAQFGADVLLDATAGLNEALEQAAGRVAALGARALLVVPSDLPLLTAHDVTQLAEALGQAPAAVLAPSRDGGTNALLVAPPGALRFAFGPGSLARHMAEARRRGLAVRLVRTPGLELDVDQPEDLLYLRLSEGTTAAQHLLRTLDLAARAACA
jgi:2-phospho-L-lactate/phosphoenolpyruvate guanylyltransferase